MLLLRLYNINNFRLNQKIMSIKFNFLNGKSQINAKNLALFSDENFQILNIKSLGLPNQGLINDLVQNNKDKKKEI